MSLVFDHSKDTLSDAMGMQDSQLKELAEKMTVLTKNFLTAEKETKSQLAEKIALELSYSELVFIATGKVLDTCAEAVEKQKQMLSKLEGLSELLEKLSGKSGENDEDKD